MIRSNLAVCFSPVLFHLNIDFKKKKLYARHRTRQQQLNISNPLQSSDDNDESKKEAQRNIDEIVVANVEATESASNVETKEESASNVEAKGSASATLSLETKNLAVITSNELTAPIPVRKKSSLSHQTLETYKRKCSQTFNKAAASIVNFSAGIVDLNNYAQNNSISTDEIEYLSKVGQLCVSDMIKYCMDLFTVCR